MKNKPTIVDLFCGAGGLSKGFEEEGFKLLLANDNDPDAAKTFKYNHSGVKFYEGDIKDLDEKKIQSFIGKQKVCFSAVLSLGL